MKVLKRITLYLKNTLTVNRFIGFYVFTPLYEHRELVVFSLSVNPYWEL